MKLRDFFSLQQLKLLQSGTKPLLLQKYQHFRALLNHNRDALRAIADLEQIYYSDHPIDTRTVAQHLAFLRNQVDGLVGALNGLADDRFAALRTACSRIVSAIAEHSTSLASRLGGAEVIPLDQVCADQYVNVGGKAAGLALMKNELRLPVPDGFVITIDATRRFLSESGLNERIRVLLDRLSPEDITALEAGSAAIQHLVINSPLPTDLATAILDAHAVLECQTRPNLRIAMRSSAVGEDGASTFAGQYATVLNVTRTGLLDAFKQVVASKYSARAIAYRLLLGLDDEDTPMSVIGLEMVNAKASGVLYTIDPEALDEHLIKISSLWGLGEQLVAGDAEPDHFLVEKGTGKVVSRHIALKANTLISLPEGGIRLQGTRTEHQSASSLDDAEIEQLRTGSERIEAHAGSAQDIEWAIASDRQLYFLQTRPLHLAPSRAPEEIADFAGLDILLSSGIAASRGCASGPIHIVRDESALGAIPDHAILVTPTAAPAYAAVIGRIAALVTEVGSITSHLASVAREFGVPAIMGASDATQMLPEGIHATVYALNRSAVVRGQPETLMEQARPVRKRYVGSPAHKKLRALLDHIVPLNLTNSRAPEFSPDNCRSFHDIIRFCHEHGMRTMFDLSSDADGAGTAVRVSTHLPLAVYIVDLGGGLQPKRLARRTVSPDEFSSAPLLAIWKGLTHPGISWEGTINFASSRFMSLMASIATSELGPEPGGDSYALAATDYLNFSAKFGYHFATVDALCVEETSHNYVSLQFAGGAGNYFGRSLRVQFLGLVLSRLGFLVEQKGDLLEANYSRHAAHDTLSRLDHLGRLLASCRLLDMTLSDDNSVQTLANAFMAGDYNLLKPNETDHPQQFYSLHGHWTSRADSGVPGIHQSGLEKLHFDAPGGDDGLVKRLAGTYQDMVRSLGAYFYFPLAIAKNSEMGDGLVEVSVKLAGGRIDRAGGVVFGLKNAANYFVFRINAMEHDVILYEYIDGKRTLRARAALLVKSGAWYSLQVAIFGNSICCSINEKTLITHKTNLPIRGHIGLWTKADSSVWFSALNAATSAGKVCYDR